MLYSSLLKLFPRAHRCAFGDEMIDVFLEAEADIQQRELAQRAAFYAREFGALIGAVARERICACHRSPSRLANGETMNMKKKNQCRFPVFSIVVMTIIFVIVVELIAKGEGLSHYLLAMQTSGQWDLGRPARLWPSQWRLVSGIVTGFGLAWLAGLTAWMVAYAMRWTGAQRLGDFEAWPLRGER